MTHLSCLDPEKIIPISRESTEAFKTGAWSRLRPHFEEKLSPCRGDCPTGNDVARAVSMASKGNFDDALTIFLDENPLPGVCGRVCYHPCEGVCNRQEQDSAVSIRALERTVAELGNADPRPLSTAGAGHPVAVVGSGPAGLAAAYHLARLGHPVTLLEAENRLGGLLAKGIPSYRLPDEVLDKDLKRILKLGITVKTNIRVDREELNRLKYDHRAIFLALGGWRAAKLGIAGETTKGVLPALAFVQQRELWPLAQGGTVAVIGGGNTAIDAARTALRHGAKRVTVVYRRDRDAMPAFDDDVLEAQEEGVTLLFQTTPTAFLHENDRINGMRLQQTRLDPNPDGQRPIPRPVTGSEQKMDVDLLLVAAGQGVEPSPLLEDLKTESDRIWVDELGRTSQSGIYAGGDLTPTRASVVDALASGKRAAISIHMDLIDQDTSTLARAVLGEGPNLSIREFVQASSGTDFSKRVKPVELTLLWYPDRKPSIPSHRRPGDRISDMDETVLTLSSDEAKTEAERCYYCGVCVDCGRCSLYCPEVSMSQEAGGAAYRSNPDYCKGCGACVAVCVRGVLTMSEEK